MDRIPSPPPDVQKSLTTLLLGFFGVTAAIFILPRTIKFVIRRFLLGIIGEIVAVVITGLLTEKMVDMVGHEPTRANGRHAPEHASTPTR